MVPCFKYCQCLLVYSVCQGQDNVGGLNNCSPSDWHSLALWPLDQKGSSDIWTVCTATITSVLAIEAAEILGPYTSPPHSSVLALYFLRCISSKTGLCKLRQTPAFHNHYCFKKYLVLQQSSGWCRRIFSHGGLWALDSLPQPVQTLLLVYSAAGRFSSPCSATAGPLSAKCCCPVPWDELHVFQCSLKVLLFQHAVHWRWWKVLLLHGLQRILNWDFKLFLRSSIQPEVLHPFLGPFCLGKGVLPYSNKDIRQGGYYMW